MNSAKQISKRITAFVLAAVMILSLSLTAFAQATYSVKIYSSSGTEMTSMNPFTGAELEYDETDDKTTITLYAEPVNYSGYTGYLESLTLDGSNPSSRVYTTATDGTTYPSTLIYVLDGEYETDTLYSMSFYIQISGFTHPEIEGYIEIVG